MLIELQKDLHINTSQIISIELYREEREATVYLIGKIPPVLVEEDNLYEQLKAYVSDYTYKRYIEPKD